MRVQINYESVFSFFDLFSHFIETGMLELMSGDSDLNMLSVVPDSHQTEIFGLIIGIHDFW